MTVAIRGPYKLDVPSRASVEEERPDWDKENTFVPRKNPRGHLSHLYSDLCCEITGLYKRPFEGGLQEVKLSSISPRS
jgi:hypothetical protein